MDHMIDVVGVNFNVRVGGETFRIAYDRHLSGPRVWRLVDNELDGPEMGPEGLAHLPDESSTFLARLLSLLNASGVETVQQLALENGIGGHDEPMMMSPRAADLLASKRRKR